MPAREVPVALIGAAVVIGLIAALNKEIVAVSLDRETARAAGLPVLALDIALYVCVSLAVVISVQTIGNILVLALLVIPAATARLLTDRLLTMMIMGPLLGALGSLLGVYLSWSADLPTGATIVLVLGVIFALAWLLAPGHGLLYKTAAARRQALSTQRRRAAA